MPTTLTTLLLEDVSATRVWGTRWRMFPRAVDPSIYPDTLGLKRVLECGNLRSPYFTIVHNGERPPVPDYTIDRTYAGWPSISGFAHPEKIEALLAKGATLKMNQSEDWCPPVANDCEVFQRELPVEAKAYFFLTPSDETGMQPHRDGSHVLVLQLEGQKEWTLYETDGPSSPDPGPIDEECRPAAVFTLEPGDALYLPHGTPHSATARNGNSLHVTYTLTEPSPEDLIKAWLELADDSKDDLTIAVPPTPDEMTRRALENMRRRHFPS